MTKTETKNANLKDISNVKKELKVDVAATVVKSARSKALQEVQKKATMPGFRQGKVPNHLLEQNFAHEIENHTIDEIVQQSLHQALTDANVRPISKPNLENGIWSADGGYSYNVTFEVLPNIDVKDKDYKGLKLEKNEVAVEKEEIEHEIKRLQQAMTQLEPVPEGTTLQEGHLAVIDYNGTADGVSFKGGEAKDFPVDMGSGGLLADFEKNLKGLKEGEQKTLEFQYPKDYFNKELAGKQAKFDVTVKSIRKKNVPEFNDEFAKDLGNYKSMDEVRDDIKTRIAQAKENQQKDQLYGQVLSELVKKVKFDVPEALVHRELSYMLESYAKDLEKRGEKLEEPAARELIGKMHPEAEMRVRGFLLLDKIATEEKVEVTDPEIEETLKNIATSNNRPIEEVRAYYEKNQMLGSLKYRILHEKTLEIVLKEAKIKVVKPEKKKK